MTPDLSIYTAAQLAQLRDDVFAERRRRLSGQQVQSGALNGQSYSLSLMSDTELGNLETAIAAYSGTRRRQVRRMDFRTA